MLHVLQKFIITHIINSWGWCLNSGVHGVIGYNDKGKARKGCNDYMDHVLDDQVQFDSWMI